MTTPTKKYTTNDFEQLLLDSIHANGKNSSNVLNIFKGIRDKGKTFVVLNIEKQTNLGLSSLCAVALMPNCS